MLERVIAMEEVERGVLSVWMGSPLVNMAGFLGADGRKFVGLLIPCDTYVDLTLMSCNG